MTGRCYFLMGANLTKPARWGVRVHTRYEAGNTSDSWFSNSDDIPWIFSSREEAVRLATAYNAWPIDKDGLLPSEQPISQRYTPKLCELSSNESKDIIEGLTDELIKLAHEATANLKNITNKA